MEVDCCCVGDNLMSLLISTWLHRVCCFQKSTWCRHGCCSSAVAVADYCCCETQVDTNWISSTNVDWKSLDHLQWSIHSAAVAVAVAVDDDYDDDD